MKVYIVYVDGDDCYPLIRAHSHNAAERLAKKLYPGRHVDVEYTEV